MGNPDDEALLFIHGYTDSWQSFRLALPDIARKYRLLHSR
jgi:pimeloyl-ACP methyl ester carboxylesterase